MSSPSSAAVQAAEDQAPLQTTPGSGLQSNRDNDAPKASYKDHRTLAICSIICGISCIGICALINSVKARERSLRDPEKAEVNSRKAWRLGSIAIAIWVGVLVLTPSLMALVSYLLTLRN